jgi:hypothetical protein
VLHLSEEDCAVADPNDYIADVAKHTSSVNEAAVAKIVKHLGIALRSKDGSLVSGTDKSELDRVREKWCKKKLALTASDADLDAAIAGVIKHMSDAGTKLKSRVTVYYLLAEKYGKLGELAG